MDYLMSLFLHPHYQTAYIPQSEKNKQLVIAVNDLFNNRKIEAAMNYFSESLLKAENSYGQSLFRSMYDDLLQVFPDIQTEIISLWADDDCVVANCICSGTHKGVASLPYFGGLLVGQLPTDNNFTVQHIRIFKILDGKIIKQREVRDDIGMYQQLGILPPPLVSIHLHTKLK